MSSPTHLANNNHLATKPTLEAINLTNNMSDNDGDVAAEKISLQLEMESQAAEAKNASPQFTRKHSTSTNRSATSTGDSNARRKSASAAAGLPSPGQHPRHPQQQQRESSKEGSTHSSKSGSIFSPHPTPKSLLSMMTLPKQHNNSKESGKKSSESSAHPPMLPRPSFLSLLSSPKTGAHAKIDVNLSREASSRTLRRRGSAQSMLSHRSEQDAVQLKLLEAPPEENYENKHIKLLPTNIPGMEAEGTADNSKPNSLIHRLLQANGSDVGILEREGEEEPEGQQYTRAGRPFLMMRPAKAALADFSNQLPENENSAQFVIKHDQHDISDIDGNSSSESDGDSEDDHKPVIKTSKSIPTLSQRLHKETSNVLAMLHLKNNRKRRRKRRGKSMSGFVYMYRFHLFIMLLSFSVAAGVHEWQGSDVKINKNVPVYILVAMPGLLSVLYLICAFIEYIFLGAAARVLSATPWSVRHVVTVLRIHFRIIAMFIIADVATSFWLDNYRNIWLRGTFRSVYAVSCCIVLKRIVLDSSINSISRTHYAYRVKQAIHAEEYLDMIASTGCSLGVREKLKSRRRLGSSWRSYGFTERSRRLTLQAMMLPYVRTQDDITEEVAYHFSTDMIIEVNTVREIRVLAYVLFDTLVKHVEYLQGLQLEENYSDSVSLTSDAHPEGYNTLSGGNGDMSGGNGNMDSARGNDNMDSARGNGTIGDWNGVLGGGGIGTLVGGNGSVIGGNGHLINSSNGNINVSNGTVGDYNSNIVGGNGVVGVSTGCNGDDQKSAAVAMDSLTFAQWNSCFNDRAQAQRARKMIFTPRQRSVWRDDKAARVIRRQDFVQACTGIFIKRELLASQVINFNKLSAMISALISRLLVLLLIFVLAACFEVDVRELLVSVSAVVLSVSFALGSSISRGIESIIFVFGTYAYSIGDRVVIGEKDTTKAAYVQSVDLLTTTFRQITGEVFIMSNADLARGRIFNLRRSTDAVVVLSFVVSFNTTWSAIDQLKVFIMKYLEKHTSSWKPGADLYVLALKRTESMEIEFWIESVHSWQSAAIVYLAQTKLLRQVRLQMNVLGITWEPTAQSLRVDMKKVDEPDSVSGGQGEAIATSMQRPVHGRSNSMAMRPNIY